GVGTGCGTVSDAVPAPRPCSGTGARRTPPGGGAMGVERTGGATRSGREEAAGDWSALVGLCASPLAAALGGILRRSVAIDADPWSLAFVHATFYVGFGLLAASALMGTRTTRARSLIFLFWAAVFAAACFVELAQGAFTATTGAPV